MITDIIIVGIGHADLDFKELDESTRNARAEVHRARDLLPWKFDKFTKYFTHADLKLEAEIVKHSGYAEEFTEITELSNSSQKVLRHPRVGGDPVKRARKVSNQSSWIPAYAGMTRKNRIKFSKLPRDQFDFLLRKREIFRRNF